MDHRSGWSPMPLRAVGYVGWGTVRRRWRAHAALVVLVAVTASLSLTAFAGARRTQSAHGRFLRSVNASTMSVSHFGLYTEDVDAALASLPGVRSSATSVGFSIFTIDGDRVVFEHNYEPVGTFDGRHFDQDRFTATTGRHADPTALDEVVVNEIAAERYSYRVGQSLHLGVWTTEQAMSPDFYSEPPPPVKSVAVTVVGVGIFPDEVLQDEADRTTRLLITPALTESLRQYSAYGLQGLETDEAGIAAVREYVATIAPPGGSQFRFTAIDEYHGDQAMRPLSIALWLFGAITAAAGLVLVGQSTARLARAETPAHRVLRSLGAERHLVIGAAVVGPVVAAALAVPGAVVLAWIGSLLMPIGPVRRLEARPGLDFDAAVLAGGGAVILGVVVAVIVCVAAVQVRRSWSEVRAPARPSSVVQAVSRAGLGPATVAGVRLSFERAADRVAPVRSVIAGTAVAMSVLVAAITFAASLRTLVDEPSLYGWTWNATVLAANGYGEIAPDAVATALGGDPNVDAWTGVHFGEDALDGILVPLLGIAPGANVVPPLLSGRHLRAADEIVIGAATARQLDKGPGDSLVIGSGDRTRVLRVVGIATLPTLGALHAVHPSLGVGAIVAPELVPGFDYNILGEPTGDLGPQAVLVRFEDDVDLEAAFERVRDDARPLTGLGGLDVIPTQRPAEIVNVDSVSNAPIALASALALSAIVSFALGLNASARGRQRELAILKATGFTRTQLAATIAWHGATSIVIGLLAGVPVGVVAGRQLWDYFARRLDVVARPTVPILVVAGVCLLALVAAMLAAIPTARQAQRVGSADLRMG